MHDIAPWAAWHGRLMVVAWVIILPLGVLVARFYKVTPGQPWPEKLDNRFWWHVHLACQYLGIAIMSAAAFVAVWHEMHSPAPIPLHGVVGWIVISLGWLQVVSGLLRGSKGGPVRGDAGFSPSALRGDHYDMTTRRLLFEYMHKVGGYVAIALAVLAVILGLQLVDASRWITLLVGAAWVTEVAAFVRLQRKGRCIDTYQAIWGPALQHPGNRIRPIGWGIRRFEDQSHERS